MSKIPVYKFDPKERYRIALELLDALSMLRTKNEIFDFLFRLLTQSEILMLARRFQIAKLLLAKMTYEEIRKKLKVSHRTISDVEKWLMESEERTSLVQKIIASTKKDKARKKNYVTGEGSMLRKYPHHRLISNLFK